MVTRSDCAAPVVVVPYEGAKVRLCGNYKVTVNTVLVVENYPLPLAEDLLAALAGSKIFFLVVLATDYQQVEFNQDAKEILTISTHQGL